MLSSPRVTLGLVLGIFPLYPKHLTHMSSVPVKSVSPPNAPFCLVHVGRWWSVVALYFLLAEVLFI